jgi:hypothetical protein
LIDWFLTPTLAVFQLYHGVIGLILSVCMVYLIYYT